MVIQVFDTDSSYECARKIFNDFIVGQSCSILGIEVKEEGGRIKPVPKGEIVLQELIQMDEIANVERRKTGSRRKRKMLPDSIGGYVAHKIFQFKKFNMSENPKVVIWRAQ